MSTMEVGINSGSGKWSWDELNNGLQFTGFGSSIDDDKRSKDRSGKSFDVRRERNTKRSWTVIPRPIIKPAKNHTTVTLQDIKGFAVSQMSESFPVDNDFLERFDKPQIDELLILLLNYFHWLFEKRSVEHNANPSHIAATREHIENLSLKLEGVVKQLGRFYGLLILGSGVPEPHSSSNGRSKMASLDQDRRLFETFYTYCVFVTWITFKRQDYDVIEYEVNKMFRSDSFNPSLSAQREKDTENLTDAEYRRLLGKRPSKMKLAKERSTVMTSIFPEPKDEASWLFNNQGSQSTQFKEKLGGHEVSLQELEKQCRNLKHVTIKQQVGIIGMALELFNLQTLTLNEEEPTNKNEREMEGTSSKSAAGSRCISSTRDQKRVVSPARNDVISEE